MKLYIANLTQQVQEFAYWTRDNPRVLKQSIPIGGQQAISGDLSSDDIDYIINQHLMYGLVEASTVGRIKPFAGICYSTGKPVSENFLRTGLQHNFQVLDQMGTELRKEAAVALNSLVEDSVNGPQGPKGYRELAVEVIEQGDDATLAEGILVTQNSGPAKGGRPRGTTRSRAA